MTDKKDSDNTEQPVEEASAEPAANEPGTEQAPEASEQPSENVVAEPDSAERNSVAEEAVVDEVTEAPQAAAEEATPPPAADPQPRRKGGVLVWLVLLIALAACGGVGYLYYELVHKDPHAPLMAELESTAARSGDDIADLERSVNERLADLDVRQSEALSSALADFDARMGAAEQGFANSLSQVMNAAPPSEREWKLAEAAYLLRVANHRLLMEQDARSALAMLEAADQILAELDDFSLHAVRAALADEMLALKRVRGADVQGLYLTIEAIKGQLATLPIAVPEYLAEKPEAPATPAGADFWQVVTDRFFSLFSFREVGREGLRPLLAPEESVYLEQNIRLTLEQAQLAVLKRHQDVYEASLTNARAWVGAYLAGDSQDVRDFVTAIDELLMVDLEQPLPDISASFSALNDVLRGVAPLETQSPPGDAAELEPAEIPGEQG